MIERVPAISAGKIARAVDTGCEALSSVKSELDLTDSQNGFNGI
jgi:hypothetical protein